MFRKVSRKKAMDQEKVFLLERKAAACLDMCLDQCGAPGYDTYGMEKISRCEAP